MKKFISVFLVFILVFGFSVFASDNIDARMDNGNIVIEYSDIKAQYLNGKDNSVLTASYNEDGKLVGCSFAKIDGAKLLIEAVDAAKEVKIWFSESSDSAIFKLNIKEEITVTPEPTTEPTIEPTIEPIAEILPTEEPDEEFIEEEITEEEVSICNFSINCQRALESDKLSEDKRESLPADGVISDIKVYEIYEGMTVYDILMQCADNEGIEIGGSESYISSVSGLAEFNCGPLSGWVYTVNGERPGAPINMYVVQPNDNIAVQYTCNLGEDL